MPLAGGEKKERTIARIFYNKLNALSSKQNYEVKLLDKVLE